MYPKENLVSKQMGIGNIGKVRGQSYPPIPVKKNKKNFKKAKGSILAQKFLGGFEKVKRD